MADLLISDDSVTVHLSGWEKAECLHGDVTFPRSSIAGVRVVSSCIDEVHGLKVAGAGFPGSLAVGTWTGGDAGRTFAACHGDGIGLVIDLAGEHFHRVVLTHDDPEVFASQLA